MQRHHRKYGLYLIMMLMIVGTVFWYRQTSQQRKELMEVGASGVIANISSKDNQKQHNNIIYIAKSPTAHTIKYTITKPDLPNAIESESQKPTNIAEKRVEVSNKPQDNSPNAVVNTTGSAIQETGERQPDKSGDDTTNQPQIVSGAMENVKTIEEVIKTQEIVMKDVLYIQRRKSIRTPRQGQIFAYEMAHSLEIGQGVVMHIGEHHDIDVLQNARQTSKNPAIYELLVRKLQDTKEYDKLTNIREENTSMWTEKTPHEYLLALWETSHIDPLQQESVQSIRDALYALQQTQSIQLSVVRHHEVLLQTRVDGTSYLYDNVGDLSDDLLQSDLLRVREYYEGQRNVPGYYRDALTAMVFIQHGYSSLASRIASQVNKVDSDYILPHQIMANAAIVKQQRKKANDYLVVLQNIDTEQVDMYQFLRGMVHYRQKKYADAVLMLREVTSPRYRSDVIRYLIMSYEHLGERKNRDQQFQSLLQYDLTPSDYYTYFALTFYVPFQNGESVVFDQEVAKGYASQCMTDMQKDALALCRYGAAGVLLALDQIERAHGALLSIYNEYPYSYIARALGDYYTQKNQSQKAMQYYFAALRTTDSDEEYALTKQKIRQAATQKKNNTTDGEKD